MTAEPCEVCGADDGTCQKLPIEDCGCVLSRTVGHSCDPGF